MSGLHYQINDWIERCSSDGGSNESRLIVLDGLAVDLSNAEPSALPRQAQGQLLRDWMSSSAPQYSSYAHVLVVLAGSFFWQAEPGLQKLVRNGSGLRSVSVAMGLTEAAHGVVRQGSSFKQFANRISVSGSPSVRVCRWVISPVYQVSESSFVWAVPRSSARCDPAEWKELWHAADRTKQTNGSRQILKEPVLEKLCVIADKIAQYGHLNQWSYRCYSLGPASRHVAVLIGKLAEQIAHFNNNNGSLAQPDHLRGGDSRKRAVSLVLMDEWVFDPCSVSRHSDSMYDRALHQLFELPPTCGIDCVGCHLDAAVPRLPLAAAAASLTPDNSRSSFDHQLRGVFMPLIGGIDKQLFDLLLDAATTDGQTIAALCRRLGVDGKLTNRSVLKRQLKQALVDAPTPPSLDKAAPVAAAVVAALEPARNVEWRVSAGLERTILAELDAAGAVANVVSAACDRLAELHNTTEAQRLLQFVYGAVCSVYAGRRDQLASVRGRLRSGAEATCPQQLLSDDDPTRDLLDCIEIAASQSPYRLLADAVQTQQHAVRGRPPPSVRCGCYCPLIAQLAARLFLDPDIEDVGLEYVAPDQWRRDNGSADRVEAAAAVAAAVPEPAASVSSSLFSFGSSLAKMAQQVTETALSAAAGVPGRPVPRPTESQIIIFGSVGGPLLGADRVAAVHRVFSHSAYSQQTGMKVYVSSTSFV